VLHGVKIAPYILNNNSITTTNRKKSAAVVAVNFKKLKEKIKDKTLEHEIIKSFR